MFYVYNTFDKKQQQAFSVSKMVNAHIPVANYIQ